MTCIVGVEHKGFVYMGGDRCGSNSSLKVTVDRSKVFLNKDVLIGFTDSFRFGDILQFHYVPAKRPKKFSDEEYVYLIMIEQIRDLLKDKGYATVADNAESGGNCLIGYRGKLYELQDDFSLNRTMNGFNAVGSGADIALGSLYTTGLEGWEPEKRIITALEAAEEFCPGVRRPFDVVRKK